MQTKTLQLTIAMFVFLGLQIAFFGTGEGRLFAAIASTLVFGMIYAAIIVGLSMFRRDDNE